MNGRSTYKRKKRARDPCQNAGRAVQAIVQGVFTRDKPAFAQLTIPVE